MGAYLSEPIVEKVSSDEKNEFIQVGASSMQGWRISQEDAHNCILNFDENTSFFAVYDGHGGAEVATYCADNLPQFLKDLKSYKGGDFESALKDAFLGFDATLLKDDVVEVLKRLAGEKNPENESDMADDEDEEDLVELCQEGTLPLDQVLEKYKGCAAAGKFPQIHKLKQGEGCGASGSAGGFGGCSSSSGGGAVGSSAGSSGSAMKPMSPFLRGRRNFRCPNIFPKHAPGSRADGPGGSWSWSTSGVSKAEAGSASPSSSPSMPLLTSSKKEVTSTATKKKLDSEFDESAVSSSSGKGDEAADDKSSGDATCTSATNGTAGLVCNSPDSSSANGKKDAHKIGPIEANPVASIQNGSITESSMSSSHQENVISTNSAAPKVAVSSSTSITSSSLTSSAAKSESSKENGEISSSPAPSGTPGPGRGASPVKITSSTSTNESTTNTITAGMAKKQTVAVNKHSMVHDEDESTSDDDADVDFHAEVDNSSTEDCEPGEEETEDEMEDEETEEDEEEMIEDDDEDNSFCSNMVEEPGKDSGCTAVIAVLNGRDLYVANAGDSRCVVCRNGKAVEMSFDHKPEDIEESDRIIKAGGKVTLDGRVNGGLNLSRAIGDHAYKMNADLPPEKQMISALPDIRKLIITPEDEFMILACDGIWNFMSSEEVVEFIRKRFAEKEKMSQICEDLFDHCLAPNTIGDGTGCDNMTAVIIRFKPKILDLPTKIDVDVMAMETIKKSTAETVPSNKRSASAISQSDVADGNTNGDSGNLKKRLKTDDDEADSVAASSDTAVVVASDDDVTMKSISSNSIGEDVPLPSAGIDSSSAPTSEAAATETTTDPSTTEAAAAAT